MSHQEPAPRRRERQTGGRGRAHLADAARCPALSTRGRVRESK